jgi:hypothetical protein
VKVIGKAPNVGGVHENVVLTGLPTDGRGGVRVAPGGSAFTVRRT